MTMKGNADDKRTLRVAAVQFESAPGDKDANFRRMEAFIEQAARFEIGEACGDRLIDFGAMKF